jgi:hypothetical protein
MIDAARALYDFLRNSERMQELIGRAEDLHFEAKRCKSFDSRMKGYVSQALSGFANSDGGIFVLGLSTERRGDDEPDVVTRVEPFETYQKVASEMLQLLGDAVMPPVDGVLVEPVDAQKAGYGYVKMLIPASDRGPHRALLAEVGEREYSKRSGSRFYRMEHFDIADMFAQRRKPDIRLRWHPMQRRDAPGKIDWLLALALLNDGRGLARFPLLEIELPKGLEVSQYGINGNGAHGLAWQRLDAQNRRHRFTGSADTAIHPGVEHDVTRVVGAQLVARAASGWDMRPENMIIPYRVAAADMPLREGVLSFEEISERVRLADELGLRNVG